MSSWDRGTPEWKWKWPCPRFTRLIFHQLTLRAHLPHSYTQVPTSASGSSLHPYEEASGERRCEMMTHIMMSSTDGKINKSWTVNHLQYCRISGQPLWQELFSPDKWRVREEEASCAQFGRSETKHTDALNTLTHSTFKIKSMTSPSLGYTNMQLLTTTR